MRVVVDAAFLGVQRGGDETFVTGLLEGLALRREPGDTFPLLLTGAAPEAVRHDPAFPVLRVPARPGPWHFAATVPAALRRSGGADLAVSVTHAPLHGRVPGVLVLGDLSFVHRPQDYPVLTARRLRSLVPLHLARARGVLVPSEYTRQDVLRTYAVDPERVHVVPNRVPAPAGAVPCPSAGGTSGAAAADEPTLRRAAGDLAARGVRPPYLLYVGNLHPRKNVPALVTAFRRLRGEGLLRRHRLVIAGGRWFRGAAEERAADGDPAVVFLGRVSDASRSLLYSRADALAYPSLFEGFGLPPLEAMAHGVPVLTSCLTSLPEVCGDSALLVDPLDQDAVRQGLVRILTDEPLRTRLRSAGPRRAAMYDADRVGVAALTAFRRAAGDAVSPAAVQEPPATAQEGSR